MTTALPALPAAPAPREWRRPAVILTVVLGLATLVRLLIASGVGFLTGDDVEVLETALASATGLHYHAWEIRNLLFPRLLVSPVLSLAGALGAHDPFWLVRIAALPFVALATLNGWLVYRLAARLTANLEAAVLAAGIFSFHWLPLAYGGTVYPRTASTTCILLAALLLAGEGGALARGSGAGALVALAFADRYSEVIFLAPFAVFVLCRDQGRRARLGGLAGLGLGFVIGASVTVGLSDLCFWGRPFSSLAAFARYTLVERKASSETAHQPLLWYMTRFYVWLPPTLLPFLIMARRRVGLALPWLGASLPLLQLSLIHHKQLRYLQGIAPFLAILVAAGAIALWDSGWRRSTVALLAASLLLSLNTARTVLSHRSTAAVEAARVLRADPSLATVAVSQAWAYGDRLFFGNGVGVLELSTPPRESEIRTALPVADALALYAADLARSPDVRRRIDQAGWVRTGELRAWNSKPVLVFHRRQGSSRAW
jgi:Alg9-like mannosyltransferase family